MKRFLLLLLLLSAMVVSVCAQSDDITLMGDIDPVFQLDNPFSAAVLTSDKKTLNIEISNIAVEADRILIRFFVTDLPEEWKNLITDDQRLYGSYLPVAELVLSDSAVLTPSSASKYSFLEYNSRLIIGGLLIFNTETVPQSFYLNFNQIPFDTQPLAEGFTKAVILSPAPAISGTERQNLSDSHNGLEFTLAASAQTGEISMLQPAVRMENNNETLSKFGWISVENTQTRKRYAVTRDNIYGFNLADDSLYSPAHAYYFKTMVSDTPIAVSMDHAYVVRFYEDQDEISISLKAFEESILLQGDDLCLRLTEIRSDPEERRIRLYLDSGNTEISDVSFQFGETGGTTPPAVYCGIDRQNDRFACDIYFGENKYPDSDLQCTIDAVEYKKTGPWNLIWIPVPMASEENNESSVSLQSFFSTDTVPYNASEEQPLAVQRILEKIEDLNNSLTHDEGWIHECIESIYDYPPDFQQDLLPAGQAAQYMIQYKTENWYYIDTSKIVDQFLTILRDPITNEIRSASLSNNGSVLDLIHALYSKTGGAKQMMYTSFRDFSEITDSSAVFISEDPCIADEGMMCLTFSQSLNGIPGGPGSQNITFVIDPESLLIQNEKIEYDRGSLYLNKIFEAPQKSDKLPEEISRLINSIE